MKPVRIQRKRTKGFNLQKVSKDINGLPCVSCTRPGKWGNPFKVERDMLYGLKEEGWVFLDHIVEEQAHQICVDLHREWLHENSDYDLIEPPTIEEIYYELNGKNLACFCSLDKPCHCNNLLEVTTFKLIKK